MASCDNFSYMALNLVGEVGELTSKIAKLIRKDQAFINYSELVIIGGDTNDDMDLVKSEVGDILWQLSGVCHVMGWSLEDVANHNLAKLRDRAKRNVIDGDGDLR